MAILDDNNLGVAAGFGKDPLEELDAELERLRIEMGDAPPAQDRPSAPKRPVKSFIAALLVGACCIAATLSGCGQTSTAPEPVTVQDDELGTIELHPPEDASVNGYSADGLVKEANGYYSYYADGVKVSEMGVDLSENQADVDFNAVRASGVDFVILRVGGRFYGAGGLYTDSKFDTYYQQAKAAGLKVGAYFFSQAISRAEGAEEAQYTLDLLNGRALDYPVAIDWEIIDDDDARTDSVGGDALTGIASAFCDTIEAAGYRAVVYANSSQILQSYNFEVMKDYDFWLADYRDLPEKDQMYYHFSIWQYSKTGSVPGIEGDVDLDLCLCANASK